MTKPGKKLPILAAIWGLVFCMAFLNSALPAWAASPVLTLGASDGTLGGKASKNGGKINNIGKNGGDIEGTVTFRDLALPADGFYTLSVTYYSGSDDRYFILTADGETYKLPCPSTGGFDRSGTVTVDLPLKKGGTLTVGSDWYGPDLGKIEIFEPERDENEVRSYENRREERFGSEEAFLVLDTANGIWSFASYGTGILRDARAECAIGGRTVSSDEFTVHRIEADGDRVSFLHENHPSFPGAMTQTFLLRPGSASLLTEVSVSADAGVETNHIAPVSVGKGGIGGEHGVFLRIPYDNDMWVEPEFTEIRKISGTAVSYEVGAFMDPFSGAGTVFGSVEHDRWKTGLILEAKFGDTERFEVAGGIADSGTRDNSPHGTLTGQTVKSPRIYVGLFSDWRDGMESFARECAAAEPSKSSVQNVPFGYNSWGVLQSKVSYSAMTAVSDYIMTHFQNVWGKDGAPVYVNIDSFWDFLTVNDPGVSLSLDEALRAFVEKCHENGQKAGIYFTPFACWHGDEEALKRSMVEGTSYTYYDAALKRSDGSGLYGKLDGGYALDPTHPATIRRTKDKLNYFIGLGFEYVKLDFMAHGACEGLHYDPGIRTGIEAYNAGMKRIHEICDGKMFVNLSIAPVFPYLYADGRRMSCDAFSSLDNTRHVLSYLTACFWEKEIYPYPDPDHLVVWGKDGSVEEGEARCRVTCGAISGTSFLAGDDLSDVKPGSAKEKRLDAMLANPGIVEIAKLGAAFRPWSVTPGEKCADIFCHREGETLYLALFNFSDAERRFAVPLEEKETGGYTVRELWRGDEWTADGDLVCSVPARDAAVCRIVPLSAEADKIDGTGSSEQTGPGSPADAVPEKSDASPTAVSSRKPYAAILVGAAAAVAVTAGVLMIRKRKKKQ